jgi:hypothetical protein
MLVAELAIKFVGILLWLTSSWLDADRHLRHPGAGCCCERSAGVVQKCCAGGQLVRSVEM